MTQNIAICSEVHTESWRYGVYGAVPAVAAIISDPDAKNNYN